LLGGTRNHALRQQHQRCDPFHLTSLAVDGGTGET
jgi:hypothetical protein